MNAYNVLWRGRIGENTCVVAKFWQLKIVLWVNLGLSVVVGVITSRMLVHMRRGSQTQARIEAEIY